MLAIKYILLSGAVALLVTMVVLLFDARNAMLLPQRAPIRWRFGTRLMFVALILLLPALSIVGCRAAWPVCA